MLQRLFCEQIASTCLSSGFRFHEVDRSLSAWSALSCCSLFLAPPVHEILPALQSPDSGCLCAAAHMEAIMYFWSSDSACFVLFCGLFHTLPFWLFVCVSVLARMTVLNYKPLESAQ